MPAEGLQQVPGSPPVVGPTTEEAAEDRHNFAQARDGAKLVAANREAKKAAAVLDDDSDTFCKNECKADKWFILELSQVAKIDTLELSQVKRAFVKQSLYSVHMGARDLLVMQMCSH